MNGRTRKLACAAVAGWIALVTATAGSAVASDPPMPRANADRTMPHIEIGIPGKAVEGESDAGMVEVRYSSGTTKALVAPNPEAGARFGAAIASTDLNHDFREDVFVGAPGKDVGGKADAGAVYVFLGTPNGLTYWRTITMDSSAVEGAAQAGAGFGSSMYYGEGLTSFVNLPIGVPGYDVGDASDAGAVVDLDLEFGDQPGWGQSAVLTAADWPDQAPETGDRFGAAVMGGSHLAIGAPGRTVDGEPDAGAVFGRPSSVDRDPYVLTQNTPDMPGAAETGDRFGRAVRFTPDRLYIGVPGEDVGQRADAGMVNTAEFPDDSPGVVRPGPGFTQNSIDEATGQPVAGSAEAGDRFGRALTHHGPQSGRVDELELRIYVGVPGEDIGQRANAGMVNVLHDPDQPGLTNHALGGGDGASNRFGAALYARIGRTDAATTNTVTIGVPGANQGRGLVKVRYPELRTWKQITGARETGDNYGASINGSL